MVLSVGMLLRVADWSNVDQVTQFNSKNVFLSIADILRSVFCAVCNCTYSLRCSQLNTKCTTNLVIKSSSALSSRHHRCAGWQKDTTLCQGWWISICDLHPTMVFNLTNINTPLCWSTASPRSLGTTRSPIHLRYISDVVLTRSMGDCFVVFIFHFARHDL